jgi:putative NIF3 family GTP cyclohydrolase 1 type 2
LTTAASRKAVFLAKHDICAISIHTKLDSISGGVNDSLLDAIGVSKDETEPFGNKDAETIGRIFTYSNNSANTAKGFAEHVKKSLEGFYKNKFENKFDGKIPVSVKYKEGDKPVHKIAAVCGGGMGFAEDALKLGIDTFFTGETSYGSMISTYEFNPVGDRVNIIAAGHFETEAVVLPYLNKTIAGEFPNVPIDIYAVPFESVL